MTENATPILGKIEEIFKMLAWDSLVEAALTSLGINAWPFNSIVRGITDKIFELMKDKLDIGAISFLNDLHERSFNSAAVTLAIISRDKGANSPEYKEARKNAKKAFADFMRPVGA